MTDNHITEIIPELDEAPEWVQQAFRGGQFFNVVIPKITELEVAAIEHEKILHNQERYWRQKIALLEAELKQTRTKILKLELVTKDGKTYFKEC